MYVTYVAPLTIRLPGDARRLVGQRNGGQLGGLAFEQFGQPGGCPSLTERLLDHGGGADHQHAA